MPSRTVQSLPEPRKVTAGRVVTPETEPTSRSGDPVVLLADQMVSATLAVVPEAWDVGTRPGAIVVAHVPPGWGDAITLRWMALVHGCHSITAESLDDEDIFSPRVSELPPLPSTLVAAVDERGQTSGGLLTQQRLRHALSRRTGLFVALEGNIKAPPSLSGAADLDLTFPNPTGAMIAAVASLVATGHADPLAEELAARVRPFDIGCIVRPGQSAEDYLRRLTRMLEATATPGTAPSITPKPVWTLDTLPLAPDVEAWAREVAADLTAYVAGTLPWSDVEHGALLAGPPGCGKTTLASALAATCGVPLIATSYATLEGGQDGKGRYYDLLRNLRATFAEARSKAPCILLFDEIDSVPARGQAGHNESWFGPITNTLLTETAVEAREGVVFLAATNFPERVDPALRRSGRLDRVVQLDLPDVAQLARILGAHCYGLSPDEQEAASKYLVGHSGADVARLARGARRRGRKSGLEVTLQDIVSELEGETPPRSEAQQRRVAVHEAGHALVTEFRRPGAVQAVNVRGMPSHPAMLGLSVSKLPDAEETLDEIDGFLSELMAGRAAEELVLGNASAGAAADLQQATALCVSVELTMGLGDKLTGAGRLDDDDISRSLLINPFLATAIEARLRRALDTALSMLDRNRFVLDELIEALLATGSLARPDVEKVLQGRLQAGPDLSGQTEALKR